MKVVQSRLVRGLAAAALVLTGAGLFVATPTAALAHDDGVYTCAGSSLQSPGVLAGGWYSSVVVKGYCAVSAGVAVVGGDLTVRPGGVLAAAFAFNDRTGQGRSELIVRDDLILHSGATAFLGCDAREFPCLDDPNQASPTVSAPVEVRGDIRATQALGVVLHHGTIGGDIVTNGGGGGVSCAPTGVFAAFQSPVFTAIEFSRISAVTCASTATTPAGSASSPHPRAGSTSQCADPDAAATSTSGGKRPAASGSCVGHQRRPAIGARLTASRTRPSARSMFSAPVRSG